jgi:hypothetical protein
MDYEREQLMDSIAGCSQNLKILKILLKLILSVEQIKWQDKVNYLNYTVIIVGPKHRKKIQSI